VHYGSGTKTRRVYIAARKMGKRAKRLGVRQRRCRRVIPTHGCSWRYRTSRGIRLIYPKIDSASQFAEGFDNLGRREQLCCIAQANATRCPHDVMLSEAKHPRSSLKKTTTATLRCAQGDSLASVLASSVTRL